MVEEIDIDLNTKPDDVLEDLIPFIKNWLESGEIQTLAFEAGITKGMAYKILSSNVNTRSKNFPFFLRCFVAARRRCKEFIAMQEQKKSMSQKIMSL